MMEDLIGALAKMTESGQITPLTLALIVGIGVTGLALVWVYRAKEAQAAEHNAQMLQATGLMTTLVEQLRTFSERQQEILRDVSTAGQNAAKNHETLARILTILEVGSKRR